MISLGGFNALQQLADVGELLLLRGLVIVVGDEDIVVVKDDLADGLYSAQKLVALGLFICFEDRICSMKR